MEKATFAPQAANDDMGSQAHEIEVNALAYQAISIGRVGFSPNLKQRRIRHMAGFVQRIMENRFGISVSRDWEKDILDFFQIMQSHPVRDHEVGSTNSGLTLWLHLLCRALQPDLIVESGVFMGRSLYILRHAAPRAELHAFDISFSKLRYRDPSIQYHECDWSKVTLPKTPKAFAYFDDHINNGRRISECHARGIQHLVFDQCGHAGEVAPFRYPGLPSALMIFDQELEAGDVLEWVRHTPEKKQIIRYQHEPRFEWGARAFMERAVPLPTLAHYTGEGPGLSAYVQLKP